MAAQPPSIPPSRVGDLTNLGLEGTDSASILVVGDGNFSYARAFMRKNAARILSGQLNVTATSLDTHEELLRMYPKAGGILDELHDGGVRVIHGINATKLETYEEIKALKFHRIAFNFPHYAEGGNKRNKIHLHRKLLTDFFQSAVHVLHREGQVWVALCAGQGGTSLDPEQRSWGDTWQVVHCAASGGLILESVHVCPVDELSQLGYYSVGYRLREKSFWTIDSLSHVFCRDDIGRRAQLPFEWTRDMSFWVLDGFTEDKVMAILLKHFQSDVVSVSMFKIDEYHCVKTQRDAVTYRVHMTSDLKALSKDKVNDRAIRALTAIEASGFAESRAK